MDPVEASEVVPGLRFRPENEVKLNYSARITEAEWERHAEAVKHMHEQRKTRREILETLHNDHEFCPSMAQLNMYMKKRKLRVYGGGNADGNGEPKDVAEDEVCKVVDVVAGADEQSACISPPARQNGDSLWLPDIDYSKLRSIIDGSVPIESFWDGVLVEVPGDEQDRYPPLSEQLSQASGTTPDNNVPEISSLNVEGPAWHIPESSNNRNIAVSEAIRDLKNAIVQLTQRQPEGSFQYTAPGAPSVCSLMSHQSDGSSLRAFRHFAAEVAQGKQIRRKHSPDSLRTLAIVSEDSWDFGLVTGMSSEKDAIWEDYRRMIKDLYINNNLSLSDDRKYMELYYGIKAT